MSLLGDGFPPVLANASQLHKATTGVDFYLRKYDVDGRQVMLQLWDIAGQDRFGSIYRVFYQHAFGAVVVFDVTDPTTLIKAKEWKEQVDAKCSLPNEKPLPVWLCANKSDLEASVDFDKLDDFCKDVGFAGWLKTSAKTGSNVNESMVGLVKSILSHTDLFAAKAATEAAPFEEDRVDLSVSPGARSSSAGGSSASGGKCC